MAPSTRRRLPLRSPKAAFPAGGLNFPRKHRCGRKFLHPATTRLPLPAAFATCGFPSPISTEARVSLRRRILPRLLRLVPLPVTRYVHVRVAAARERGSNAIEFKEKCDAKTGVGVGGGRRGRGFRALSMQMRFAERSHGRERSSLFPECQPVGKSLRRKSEAPRSRARHPSRSFSRFRATTRWRVKLSLRFGEQWGTVAKHPALLRNAAR